jgi:hypothetical protein
LKSKKNFNLKVKTKLSRRILPNDNLNLKSTYRFNYTNHSNVSEKSLQKDNDSQNLFVGIYLVVVLFIVIVSFVIVIVGILT